MAAAPTPADEEFRLQILRGLDVLDTAPEDSFDDVAKMAARICDAPIALVSLVDETRQWFKACVGLGERATPREQSFCAYAILRPDQPLVVEDASKDSRFQDNPLVTGPPNIRMYVGHPLLTEDGVPLGTLCVIDDRPRRLTESQMESLRVLSEQVSWMLQWRQATKALKEARDARLNLFRALAHDLAGPILPMRYHVDALRTANAPKEHVAGLELELKWLEGFVQDMRSLVEGMHGDDAENIRTLSVAAFVAAMASAEIRRFEEAGRLFVTQVDGRPKLQVNPARLRAILGNLVSNAFHHGAGTVTLSVRPQGEWIEFVVQDEGPGFDPAEAESLFEPFKRGSLIHAADTGLGLGLHVSRHSAEGAGGTLTAHSTGLGRGARFTLRLPIQSSSTP